MHRRSCSRLLVASTLILAAPLLATAQIHNIADLAHYIKAPSDTVRYHFGSPDTVWYSKANAAEIWTYYHDEARLNEAADRIPLDSTTISKGLAPQCLDKVRATAGFTQFAFWNGHVAAVSHTQTDEQSASLYERTIAYLKEHAGWLGSGDRAPTFRITRMGDNTWTAYRTPGQRHVQTVLTVGDAGYMMCSKTDNSAERDRVKKQFGLSLSHNQ